MFRGRMAYAAAMVMVAALSFIGQAYSQEGPATQDGGRRGNRDPEQMRQRMEQARQQMETRMKEQLGVTDDEWKVLQPKMEKVMTLQRQSRGGGMGMFAMGGGRGGRGGRGEDQGPQARPGGDRQQSEVEQKMIDLQNVLQNKDASPDAIKNALTGYREARAKAKEELEKAQTELRELLTVRQEAVFISMGMLE